MANSTFSGPVRSQNGFQTISVNSTTGAVTTTSVIGPAMVVDSVTATGNLTADSGTAPVAGGAAAFLATSTAGLGVYFGSGAPTVSAAQGSLYIRTDGSSTSTRLYVNTNGSTTWTNVTTAA
ncbi:MAG: hypothetical protein EBR82_76290 [Caulobacteraceae bacterium]|nr:hypothetical protein [Caulobacteraceae bacterium]